MWFRLFSRRLVTELVKFKYGFANPRQIVVATALERRWMDGQRQRDPGRDRGKLDSGAQLGVRRLPGVRGEQLSCRDRVALEGFPLQAICRKNRGSNPPVYPAAIARAAPRGDQDCWAIEVEDIRLSVK